MTTIQRYSMPGVALLVALAVLTGGLTARTAEARPPLPFVAYGTGLAPGQVVQAFDGFFSIALATADAHGNWLMYIESARTSDGATLSFTVDGRRALETATFRYGGFTPRPGVTLITGER